MGGGRMIVGLADGGGGALIGVERIEGRGPPRRTAVGLGAGTVGVRQGHGGGMMMAEKDAGGGVVRAGELDVMTGIGLISRPGTMMCTERADFAAVEGGGAHRGRVGEVVRYIAAIVPGGGAREGCPIAPRLRGVRDGGEVRMGWAAGKRGLVLGVSVRRGVQGLHREEQQMSHRRAEWSLISRDLLQHHPFRSLAFGLLRRQRLLPLLVRPILRQRLPCSSPYISRISRLVVG